MSNVTLNEERVRGYLGQNFPIFCATCTKLPEGQSRGSFGCGVTTCGGPMNRSGARAFPDYDGPIPEDKRSSICMKCGHSEIKRQIIIGDKRLGLCTSHMNLFETMKFEVGDKGFVSQTNAAKLLHIDV